MIHSDKLDTVIDYENKAGLFPEVHRMYRFCIFITKGTAGRNRYKFFQSEPSVDEDFVIIKLEDIININPNSKTCPSFKNYNDYRIAKNIYSNNNVLINEENPEKNPYNVEIRTPFNMSNDSGMFKSYGTELLPLYEAKYIYLYTYRYANWENDTTNYSSIEKFKDPTYEVKTQYYLEKQDFYSRFKESNWNLVYRMITHATQERTMIASIIPGFPCGNSLSLISGESLKNSMLLLGNFNCLIFDFLARQKVGAVNFNHWILKQLPVIDPSKMPEKIKKLIIENVFKLIYSSHSLAKMAGEYGVKTAPFVYNIDERYKLICEIEILFFKLYNINKIDMEYILDSFSIYRKKEIIKYDRYRTKETILQLYDEFTWVDDEMNKQEKTIKTEQA